MFEAKIFTVTLKMFAPNHREIQNHHERRQREVPDGEATVASGGASLVVAIAVRRGS